VCNEPQRALINVDVHLLLCPRHGAPYRDRWPLGYPTLVARLLEWLVADQAIWEEVGAAPDGGVSAVGQALTARPLCCRIPAAVLKGIYLESGINRGDRRCDYCGRSAGGTRCQGPDPHGRVNRYGHVCFFDYVLCGADWPFREPAGR
jgi:hypothetical protein